MPIYTQPLPNPYPNPHQAANAVLPTYVTMCMYFGGLFLLFDKIPDGWQWSSWTSSNPDLARTPTLTLTLTTDPNP